MSIKDWFSFTSVPEISAESLLIQVRDNSDAFFLLDVRSHFEWKQGHIQGSQSIPLHTFNIDHIPKDKTIVCICLSAHRSTPITRQLLRNGYNAYELSGGMRKWKKLNYPTEST